MQVGALLLTVLVVGVIVSRWQTLRAIHAEEDARTERVRLRALEQIVADLKAESAAGSGDLPLSQLLTFEGQSNVGFPQGWTGGPRSTILADDKVVHGGHWSGSTRTKGH